MGAEGGWGWGQTGAGLGFRVGSTMFTLEPQLAHAVVDVHHPFPLGHVQHDVNGDETAGPARTSTAWRRGLSQRGQKDPRCCFLLDPAWGEIHRTWNDHQKRCTTQRRLAPSSAINACSHRVPKHFHHPKGTCTRCPRLVLTCSATRPALGGLLDFTCRTKPSSSGVVGDPIVASH